MTARWFAITLIALMLCASIAYACESDWRRAGYWASAALLNVFVSV
jgi:hypothetical protein